MFCYLQLNPPTMAEQEKVSATDGKTGNQVG